MTQWRRTGHGTCSLFKSVVSVEVYVSPKTRRLAIPTLVILLSHIGCATSLEDSHSDIQGNGPLRPTIQTIEVDDEITPDEFRDGLKKAKLLLTGNPFLTPAENNISNLQDYSQALDAFIGSSVAGTAILSFFARLLKLPATDAEVPRVGTGTPPPLLYDRLEPASLPAYLYLQRRDFREFVTASYCVGRPEENYVVRDCRNAGQVVPDQNNQRYEENLPSPLKAGFITTQSFLKTAAGALNFRRAYRLQQITLCTVLPSGYDSTGWTEPDSDMSYPDLTTHPFYWTRLQAPGAMNCKTCHSGTSNLNSWRVLFTGFDALGAARMGQTIGQITIPGITINNVEAALITNPGAYASYAAYNFQGPTSGSLDPNTATPFEPNEAKILGQTIPTFTRNTVNRSYADVSTAAAAIANHPAFASCMATHFFHLAMKGEPYPLDYKPPTHLMEQLVTAFKDSNFNAQTLLKAILMSPAYLNQAE